VKIIFAVKTSRGVRSKTVDEGEEESDGTRVETHSGGQGRTGGLPLLGTLGLRPLGIFGEVAVFYEHRVPAVPGLTSIPASRRTRMGNQSRVFQVVYNQ
jgi:hypothetical protein